MWSIKTFCNVYTYSNRLKRRYNSLEKVLPKKICWIKLAKLKITRMKCIGSRKILGVTLSVKNTNWNRHQNYQHVYSTAKITRHMKNALLFELHCFFSNRGWFHALWIHLVKIPENPQNSTTFGISGRLCLQSGSDQKCSICICEKCTLQNATYEKAR